jgi:DNA invertase Pin-like site-specific DNA recombinase
MRCAIYARYSSDRQSEASAEDQARLCRERAAREGWTVVAEFLDHAVSGATRDRPQLTAMMARAAEFDVVLCESLDRLSRDKEDIHAIEKRLSFAGVEIVTLADGAIGGLLLSVKGAMAAEYLKDLGDKTRRGQIGRVAAGRIPGGLSYGYEKVHRLDAKGEPERGLRAINDEQAAIVRRIFREYAAGVGPREIARALNADGVKPPRGDFWRANTIIGHRKRRNGIINNELYAGRIVFNRQRFVRDPETRKRVSRPNPESEWLVREEPELRIVDEETWAAVSGSTHRRALPLGAKRRAKRLLSGLVRCGICGDRMTIVQRGYWGCARRREARLCSNARMLRNDRLEARVLDGLTERMLEPEMFDAYFEAYYQRANEVLRERRRSQAQRAAGLREAEAKIKRLVDAIAGGADVAAVRQALHEAVALRDALKADLDEIDPSNIIPMQPRLAESYRRRVHDLAEGLNGEGVERAEARAMLRGMIEKIVLVPPAGGLHGGKRDGADIGIEVHGRLAEILTIAETTKKAPSGEGAYVTFQLVAGARSRLCSALSIVRV